MVVVVVVVVVVGVVVVVERSSRCGRLALLTSHTTAQTDSSVDDRAVGAAEVHCDAKSKSCTEAGLTSRNAQRQGWTLGMHRGKANQEVRSWEKAPKRDRSLPS